MVPEPRRGEIWDVQLDPTRGAEIQKTRPVVVVSSDAMNKLPLRIVIPVTTYQEKHARRLWSVPVESSAENGLTGKSTVLPEQTRCVATERFMRKRGDIEPPVLEEIEAALKVVLDLR